MSPWEPAWPAMGLKGIRLGWRDLLVPLGPGRTGHLLS
jgi:hypothetical protein